MPSEPDYFEKPCSGDSWAGKRHLNVASTNDIDLLSKRFHTMATS